uniref:Uncharacterized protein n=1 Tax=Phakopsora pachyrhizi TaxID=170000 RepID=A0A0S1MK28_PHAPC
MGLFLSIFISLPLSLCILLLLIPGDSLASSETGVNCLGLVLGGTLHQYYCDWFN